MYLIAVRQAEKKTLRVRRLKGTNGEPFASQPANGLRPTLRVRQAARNETKGVEGASICS